MGSVGEARSPNPETGAFMQKRNAVKQACKRLARSWFRSGIGSIFKRPKVSNGFQKGPPIGVQKGPLCRCADRLMLGARFALLAAYGGSSPTGGVSSAKALF